MNRYFVSAVFAAISGLTPILAQSAETVAMVESPAIPTASATVLPDAPSAVVASSSNAAPELMALGTGDQTGTPGSPIAGRYETVILPGQKAVELHGMERAVYGLHDSFSLTTIAGFTLSAGWSQLIDSQPHFGRNGEAFGKREGAAALRSTIQTMATDAVFSPMFHDDPRYYMMGDSHKFLNRVFYAASRVIITKSSHSDTHRINAPLLLGYGVAAASNNAYYPDQDLGAQNTFENWGTSLVGAALGFEVSEFIDDALHAVHIRRN